MNPEQRHRAREAAGGFRGVQSKSLMDIIQLECLSQSSSVLRITNGPLVGKIWINHGELVDAEAGSLKAEEAFQHILSWKSGSFEVLTAEPDHPRIIQVSYNALLLDTAQQQHAAKALAATEAELRELFAHARSRARPRR